ncbi:MAG TPA: M42 family metallopeptidase [Actinomycetota bacterium]|nr:M42 family metallopeptidase [Actinomycetota bacterium]
MQTLDVLRQLSEAVGVAGMEDEVRDLVTEMARPLCDEVHVDVLGNVICTRRGRRDEVLLLDAHMDEVGFLVAHVDDAGFLRLGALGGWDARILLSHAITVRTRDGGTVRGVIGTAPPHVLKEEDRKRTPQLEDLFVDIGASSAAEVAEMGVRVGDQCVPSYGFERLSDDLVMGKAFDDRAGCTVAVRVLDELQGEDLDLSLAVSFSIGEEVGLRGARTVAHQVSPTVALALEGTTAVDIPGVGPLRRSCRFGGGPAITIADPSLVADRRVVRLLEEVAERGGITVQHKVPLYGGSTNAGVIHLAGAGVMCGVVSVPCRYIHTPLSMLRPSDLEGTITLVAGFTRSVGSLVG